MNNQTSLIRPEQIEQAILLIRDQRAMLDRDLAALYGVTTANLNKAVQRNPERFPPDFMFQLTADEAEDLRFQFGSLKRGQHFKYLRRSSRRRASPCRRACCAVGSAKPHQRLSGAILFSIPSRSGKQHL